MAELLNKKTGEGIALRVFHKIGRNTVVNHMVLEQEEVSAEHASICWDGDQWVLKDISRNGTWVGNVHLLGGTIPLRLHVNIRFPGQPHCNWTVVDLSPPPPCLEPLNTSTPFILLQGFNRLSIDEKSNSYVVLSRQGDWLYEFNSDVSLLKHGDEIRCDNNHWSFCCAQGHTLALEETRDTEQIYFEFNVSLDEEHVTLSALVNQVLVDLKERVFYDILLYLARQRITDLENGLSEKNQGWLSVRQLSTMIRKDEAYINIQIFRIRAQLVRSLPTSANIYNIVERRSGQIRFNHSKFKVIKGFQYKGVVEERIVEGTLN